MALTHDRPLTSRPAEPEARRVRPSAPPNGGTTRGPAPARPRKLAAPPDPATAGQPVPTPAVQAGGGRRLVGDIRIAFLLTNHLRVRLITQLFGVGREEANLLTLVGAMALTQAAQVRIRRWSAGPPLPPPGDGLLAVASIRELMCRVAGPASRDTPLVGTLLTLAVVAGTAGPTVVRSARALRASGHRATAGFHHRYGYLVDPGHWRQRRAAQPHPAQRTTA